MRRIASMVAVSVLVLGSVACSSAGGGGGDGDASTPGDADVKGDGSSQGSDGGANADGGSGGGTAVIQFPAMCPAFTACGGALEGTTWDYSSGCVSDAFAQAKQLCPSLVVKSSQGTAKGYVAFSGGSVTRKADISIEATLEVPPACTQNGLIPCSTIATGLKNGGYQATCTGTSTCTCNVTKSSKIDSASAYAITGNTVSVGAGQEYDFCVQGNKLGYEAKDQGLEPGQYELTKR